MSSSNDPYKSRLLNFLNRQTIHFQDKLGTSVRYLRSATEMSVQLLLYPFYLMVQSGRVARQQLESRVQSSLLLSAARESESDSSSAQASTSLEEVLDLVEPWLEATEAEKSNSTATETIDVLPIVEVSDPVDPWLNISSEQKVTPPPSESIQPSFAPVPSQTSTAIRGIASLIDSQQLVLVDHHNRLFNVLNPRQQELLQQYLVKSNPKPNLLVTMTQKVLASLPTIAKTDSSNPLPVKFFWQTVDWLQSSSVATKVNLFGESKLTKSSPVLPPSNSSFSLPQFLASLDNQVAELETKSFSPGFLSVNHLGDRLSRLSQSNNTLPVTESRPDLDSNPFQIRAIIKAAIDYFFGPNASGVANKIKGNNVSTLPTSVKGIPLESKTASSYLPGKSSELHLPQADEQESWLSWNDLFRNTVSSTVKPGVSVEPDSSLNVQQFPSLSVTPVNSTPSFSIPTEKTENSTNLTYFNSAKTPAEKTPDLLETKATTVGYEKHLLVRILELLDQIILWLEEKLIQIWRLFRLFK